MKLKFSALLLTTVLSANSYANPCISMLGSCICKDSTIDNISGQYAGLMIENMKVTGIITGNHAGIDIEKSTINEMNVQSAGVNISDSTFTGNIKGLIAGLVIENSYAKDLNIKGKEVYINQSNLEKITISNNQSNSNSKVTLIENSTVMGNIVFRHNKGTVCIDKTSKVQGKIINGEVITGDC